MVLSAVSSFGLVGTLAPARALAAFPDYCGGSSDPIARADELLNNRYLLPPHPIVTLPANPTWSENPLNDRNWQYQFHAMRYVADLLRAWWSTGNATYSDRALFLLQDWYQDNPRTNPPSVFSWNDHSTAWRAVIYACTADVLPMTTWLHAALVLHGQTLADPTFYVGKGNHALDQAIGLLEVGRVLARSDWMTLARDRINALVVASVDSQGVTNEQSVGYELFNFERYSFARSRLLALGLTVGSGFSRIDLMPRFLAEATLPNGQFEMIGDTDADRLPSIPGTWAEFVATAGASGPTPALVAAYSAGYLFARSGWGTTRAFADETFLSLQWGPGKYAHGDQDGTALTLYGWGSRLLVDPGRYTYNGSSWDVFFDSRRAHNVVTVDGLTWNAAASTSLLGRTTTSSLIDVRLRTSGYSGITQERRMTYSRGLDFILVEDRMTSASTHTYRQLWHLVNGSNPAVGTYSLRTRRTRGNVYIRELVGSPSLAVVTGATSPIQGWISYTYGQKVAAPVLEATRRGTSLRFLTLIVPSAGSVSVQIRDLVVLSDGYAVTVTIGTRSQRVVASGSTVSVTNVP